MRLSSVTGVLSCDSCPKGSVVKVNMLGVILNICNTSYYMCPCCTKVQVWRGDGMDLCNSLQSINDYTERMKLRIDMYKSEGPCNCSSDILNLNHKSFSDLIISSNSSMIQTRPPLDDGDLPRCMICDAKNTKKPFMVLPDVHKKILVRCYLCVRHSLPEHMKAMITNTLDLGRALSGGGGDGNNNHGRKNRKKGYKHQ